MPTTNTKLELNWENLLTEALTKPGKILAAYSLFHNYYIVQLVICIILAVFPLLCLLGTGCLILPGGFDDSLEITGCRATGLLGLSSPRLPKI
jgi:hypothetical protein